MVTYAAKISEIIQEAPQVKLIRLSFQELKSFKFLPGQFVMIGHSELKGETGLPVQRAFSVASAPSQKDYLELCVKIVEGGKFSKICRGLKKNDTVEVKGPFGKFHLPQDHKNDYAFFAGGTGVAPLMSMLHELKKDRFPVKVVLFFTFREPQDYLYKKELEEMNTTYSNFTLVTTCTSKQPAGWEGMKGRFTVDEIKKFIQ